MEREGRLSATGGLGQKLAALSGQRAMPSTTSLPHAQCSVPRGPTWGSVASSLSTEPPFILFTTNLLYNEFSKKPPFSETTMRANPSPISGVI